MPGERGQFAGPPCLPEKEVARPVRRRQTLAIGGKLEGRHPVGVLADLVGQPSVGRLQQPHDLGRPAERDIPLVGRDVGREHLVKLLPHLGHPLRRGDVPHDHPATRGRPPAARQQELGVAGEPRHANHALGKRQHPHQVERAGVVEEHLLAAPQREHVAMRRGGQRGHGRRPPAPCNNLERQPRRHHGWSVGLRGHHRINRDRILLASHRLGAVSLDRSAGDPVFDQVE